LIKNYEYGLLDPTVNTDLIIDQMRLRHRYQNKLVEIERERRAAVAKVLLGHPDAEVIGTRVEELVKQLDEARCAIKATRKATRARSETVLMRERVKAIATELKGVRAELKAAKALASEDPIIAAAIEATATSANVQVRAARATCGTYWGSYLLAEQAMDAAKKSKAPPDFCRWTGDGRVSVQLQGGIDRDEAWGGDTQIVIAPVTPTAHDPAASRGQRRLASRTTLRMRVQSTDKGKPVWAEWPMILHRPIPEGARIKVATVSRRRRDCRRWDWRLLLTLEIPDATIATSPRTGAVALNLGWCQDDKDTVRAGYLVSSDGAVDRSVLVARQVIDRVEKSEAIRSQRDQNLDVMRSDLVTWLRAHESTLPEWIVDRTILSRAPRAALAKKAPRPLDAPSVEPAGSSRTRSWHVIHWRSAARFSALVCAWKTQRFSGDSDGYDLLERWRYRDEHLQRYEAGLSRGALLDRRESYRILAADLAQRYRTLVIDNFDLRTFQESPKPEETRVEVPTAKRNQRHAAGSILRASLLSAFGESRVLRERSADVTRACSAVDAKTGRTCGVINEWNHALARLHTCTHCGVTWDQDANACRNLLAAWRERGGDVPLRIARADEVVEKPKETRSQRLRSGAARKRARDKGAIADEVTDVGVTSGKEGVDAAADKATDNAAAIDKVA